MIVDQAPCSLRQALKAGLTVGIPVIFLLGLFVVPVANILSRGLRVGGELDLSPVIDVIKSESLRKIIAFTFIQATISTLLTVIVGIPGAYVLYRYRFTGRGLVRALVTVPFVLPTMVVASAFLALGVKTSFGAILVAHIFFNYAVVVRTVGGLWAHLDHRTEIAAQVLGASKIKTFIHITLPALRPAILASGAICFLFTFTSFGIILILGGPSRATLETEIYRQTAQLLDFKTAAGLSVVQLIAVTGVLLITSRLITRQNIALGLVPADRTPRVRTRQQRLLLLSNLSFMALLLGLPMATLIIRSFSTPTGFGLAYYRALGTLRADSVLFVPPVEAIKNSIVIAVISAVIAVTVGGLAAHAIIRYGQALNTALTIPLGVSAVTVGFGFLITFDTAPFNFRSSWLLLPFAHALIAIPFVVRAITPILSSIDPRLREAAKTLGANPLQVWREVDLPISARAYLVGAGFAIAISLGEFGATAFLARPDRPTLPVVIARLLSQPGELNFGAALAASSVLMVLVAGAIFAIERARVGSVGTF